MPERAEWKSELSKVEQQAVAQLEVDGAVIKPFDVEEFKFHGLLVRFDNDQLTPNGLISDKSATALSVLRKTLLELRQTTLNKSDLAKIYRLKNLKGLDLAATSTLEERSKFAQSSVLAQSAVISFPSIAKMNSLIMLDLSDNCVNNADVAELSKLKKLRSLSLINTSISDDCLKDLQKLRRLRELYLTKTRMSASAVKQLRQKLPNCCIEV